MKAPLPKDEAERLEAVHRFAILDTLPEQAFDDLTLIASEICQAPIALVSLIDDSRQWFKSRVGLDVTETHRDFAFCAHAILNKDEVLQVGDALLDPRFVDNPLVTSDPNIRFYAGVLLLVHDHQPIGTLCVIDYVPRVLSDRQKAALAALGRRVAALIEDRLINAELDRAKTRAEHADRLKSAFLATMSHELRTPLNSIIGFTGILIQGLAGPLNAEQSTQLGMVQTNSRHLLALINDVLDLSKIEAGELKIAHEPFNLKSSINKVIALVRPLAKDKGLTLHTNISLPETLLDSMVGDARRVEQVMINLLNNAIKFTEHGGVTLNTTLSNGEISLAVTDTGIGISTADMSVLFEPFRQIDDGLARTQEGSGLGLTISRRLAQLMGGEIHASSEVGRGSAFTLTLPLPHHPPTPSGSAHSGASQS